MTKLEIRMIDELYRHMGHINVRHHQFIRGMKILRDMRPKLNLSDKRLKYLLNLHDDLAAKGLVEKAA